jgi:hypothetical protein
MIFGEIVLDSHAVSKSTNGSKLMTIAWLTVPIGVILSLLSYVSVLSQKAVRDSKESSHAFMVLGMGIDMLFVA